MIVMIANNTGIRAGFLAGKFPGKIGHLYSPGAQCGPYEFAPYALDNNRFGAYKNNATWDEGEWRKLLAWSKLSGQRPLWALVPDVVADRDATLRDWALYSDTVARCGFTLAFAVQDGMLPSDVPNDAEVVFVGGSFEWKWRTVRMWCSEFSRVHVGRVNTYKRLWQCRDAGAESTDGTGFMRGDQLQYRGLIAFLEESTGSRPRTIQLPLEREDVRLIPFPHED